MKLVLFGGIAGVGKTTLLTWLEGKLGEKIRLLDPGELFRRYHYHKRLKTMNEVEELIAEKIENMPDDALVVVHWHYAVHRPDGYIPQIAFSRLKRLARSGKIKRVALVLVEASVDAVLERRMKESRLKKRALSSSTIREEAAMEEEFLKKYQALFSNALGAENIAIFHLVNTDLETAKTVLFSFFKPLVG